MEERIVKIDLTGMTRDRLCQVLCKSFSLDEAKYNELWMFREYRLLSRERLFMEEKDSVLLDFYNFSKIEAEFDITFDLFYTVEYLNNLEMYFNGSPFLYLRIID